MPRRILFVVNNPDFFLSHRLPVARAAAEEGYEVHVAAPDTEGADAVRSHGFAFHPVAMDRSRGRPWRELATVAALRRLYLKVAPDVVHHVTIKPVLYGSLAARMARVPAVVNAVSGMGYLFIARGAKAALSRLAANAAYRVALRLPRLRVIFQNPDDYEYFIRHGLVRPEDTTMIKGSGADTDAFRPLPEPPGPPVVMLASRMLWDKGVGEFARAAARLRAAGTAVRFVLVGNPDPGNPASVPREWLEEAARRGDVEWWGKRRCMEEVLSQAHVVCLPSYREGLPKVLIEAAACGRPIVTTDAPGCREIVRPGENGFLVPVGDDVRLAEAIGLLLGDPALRTHMGRRGREMVEEEFSLASVVERTLGIYRELTGGPEERSPGSRIVSRVRKVAHVTATKRSSAKAGESRLRLPVLILLLASVFLGSATAQQFFYPSWKDLRLATRDSLVISVQYKSDYQMPWQVETVVAYAESLASSLAFKRLGSGSDRDPYWYAWHGSLVFRSLAPGSHVLRVVATDTSGYRDTLLHPFKYNRDPPVIVIELPDTSNVYGDSIPIRAHCVDDAGECSLRVSLDGTDLLPAGPTLDTVISNPRVLPVIGVEFSSSDPSFISRRWVVAKLAPDHNLKDTSEVPVPDLSSVGNLQTCGEWTAYTKRGAAGELEAWLRKGQEPEERVEIGESVARLGYLAPNGELMVIGARNRWLRTGSAPTRKICSIRYPGDFHKDGKWFVTWGSRVFVVVDPPISVAIRGRKRSGAPRGSWWTRLFDALGRPAASSTPRL